MILQLLILILLIIGSIYDLKYRLVPRLITVPIVLLSLPLIHINLINIFLIAFIIAAYRFKKTGLADLIVLIPLMLIVPNVLIFWILYNFIGLVTIFIIPKSKYNIQASPKNFLFFGHSIKYNPNIPAFVPITIAYAFVV